MINDALPVWITGNRAARNTLWLLKKRADDARHYANPWSRRAFAMRMGRRRRGR
jgi:hypothetical protein